MKRALLVFVVLGLALWPAVLGCAVPVHAPQLEAPDRERVEQAAGDLDLRVQWTDDPHGAIDVYLRPRPPGGNYGETRRHSKCAVEVDSTRHRDVLRHELGHALGLGHHDDPANVMHTPTGGDTIELTREQRAVVIFGVLRLRRCRP